MSAREVLIDKLEEISGLYKRTVHIAKKIKNYEPEDNYERSVQLPLFPGGFQKEEEQKLWIEVGDHRSESVAKQVLEAHAQIFGPKEPQKPVEPTFKGPAKSEEAALKQAKGLISIICLALGVMTLFIGLGSLGVDALTGILNLAICGFCGFYLFQYYTKLTAAKKADAEQLAQLRQQHDKLVAEQKAKYEADMEEYKNQTEAFKTTHEQFAKDYAAWREVYARYREEEEVIAQKLEKDRAAAVDTMIMQEFAPVKDKLDATNDLVPDDYMNVLDTLIGLIKSRRADDVKEAINLYEDILYKERQLELQREQEENRRREEEQRREDEERRYREEVRRQEAAERQQRADEERRHKEAMDLQKRQERDRQAAQQAEKRQQERAELDRKMKEDSATRRQCNACALNGKCSVSYTRPNCASFRPR